MKQLLIVFISLFFSMVLVSQTYFYAESITIEPEVPTDEDNISIIISGNLSDTGSQIDSTYFNIIDNELYLTMDCSSMGGFQVLVPHDETISIGKLDAGSYHVNLSGIGYGEYISDTTQYYFYVSEEISINETPDNSKPVKIYPNPIANDKLYISISDSEKVVGVYIYNSEGKLYFSDTNQSTNQFTVDISKCLTGMYFIYYITQKAEGVEKLIIQ